MVSLEMMTMTGKGHSSFGAFVFVRKQTISDIPYLS